MAAGQLEPMRDRALSDMLAALARDDGSVGHLYATNSLAAPGAPPRDLADAVHLLAMLHGQRPGILDVAHARLSEGKAARWIDRAVDGFAEERGYLTRLVVAAGPLPSTPGQAGTEAAVITQRGALEMLARSDRLGCPLGAAIGLALDWPAVRAVLDAAAARFGVPKQSSAMPSAADTLALAALIDGDQRAQRAVCFGAEQVFVQHRALWDLLESRCSARG